MEHLTVRPRTGRPPKRPEGDGTVTITLRIPAAIKRALMDQADAYDLSLSEYLAVLVERAQQA